MILLFRAKMLNSQERVRRPLRLKISATLEVLGALLYSVSLDIDYLTTASLRFLPDQ